MGAALLAVMWLAAGLLVARCVGINRYQEENMNPNKKPAPRWPAWLGVALIFAGYGVLEAHDAHTEMLIAEADAEAAIAVAQVARQYGIECEEPHAVIAEVQP